MKKQSLLFVLLASAMLSCTDAMQESFDDDLSALKFQELDKTNLVSYDNIVALNTAQTAEKEEGRPMDGEQDIDCITDGRGDTLLYVCSKRDGGWTMYSSDTRIPPILAQSDKGSFSDVRKNENAMAWIQTMAEDVKLIRSLGDDQLKLTQEEIEANRDFWRSVSDPDGFVKDWLKKHSAKGLDGGQLPSGHYSLVSTEYDAEVYDSIGRLTETNWHQFYPFNLGCPLKSNSNTVRAPAGCVAIAGAQMLYFLNGKFGIPETAPSYAYCNSHVNDSSYDWAQTNYTTTIWDSMNNPSSYSSAAPLIANVGARLGMHYGDDSSWAYTIDLKDDVFSPYGIDCSFSSYNFSAIDELETSLLDGIPVILDACAQHEVNGSIQVEGHAFIADRYKRMRTLVTRTYVWVWDGPVPIDIIAPLHPRKIECEYTLPYVSYIGINWGWGQSNASDEAWYAIMGDWVDYSIHYNWNIDRHLMYDFHPKQ